LFGIIQVIEVLNAKYKKDYNYMICIIKQKLFTKVIKNVKPEGLVMVNLWSNLKKALVRD
jgi:hypothetical protein